MNHKKVDIFTVEVIKNALVAIGEVMFLALKKSSMSPVIYEALDYGIGITDADGCLIAQGNGIPGFIGTLDGAVKSIIDKYPTDEIRDGDIYMQNIPYSGGGTHLSDVCMIKPVFFQEKLVAWTANKAHWTEIGGKDPGSVSADSTEIYQEGLQFPGIKIFDQGEPNQAVIELLRANVRLPDMTLGDMWSSVAALRIGENRFIGVIKKYGLQTTLYAINSLLDHAEAMVAEQFKHLPKGVFTASDIIDSDGVGNGPFTICVKVTITDDMFTLDYTGTDLQVPGPINMPFGGLMSSAREVYMGIVDPGVPANDGCFRRLNVICPEGTLCSATHPAPVSAYYDVMVYATDVVRKALAEALPGKLLSGQYGAVCTMILSGTSASSSEPFIMVQPLAGGWGAGVDKDGESGQFCLGNGDTRNIPVEITETRYDVLVEQYAFNNEGYGVGAGRQRGGKGLVLDYRVLSDADVTITFGREKTPPWAIAGGAEGSCNFARVVKRTPSGESEVGEPFSRGRVKVKQGNVIRVITGGGAGWGDPHERSDKQIEQDLKNGFITEEESRKIYGYSGRRAT